MEKKVSEKEKFYQRAVKSVERLVAAGTGLTQARNIVAAKFGIGGNKIIEITMHLSPKAQNTAAE